MVQILKHRAYYPLALVNGTHMIFIWSFWARISHMGLLRALAGPYSPTRYLVGPTWATLRKIPLMDTKWV